MKATAKVKEITEPLVKKNCALRCGQRLRFPYQYNRKQQKTPIVINFPTLKSLVFHRH